MTFSASGTGVGAIVGATVGVAAGVAVGAVVGIPLGLVVGAVVGLPLGAIVGDELVSAIGVGDDPPPPEQSARPALSATTAKKVRALLFMPHAITNAID